MKLVFMGSPLLAVKVLEALVKDGYNIAGVYTSPDKIVGRGRKLQYSPVKSYAIKERLPVYQPHSINSLETYNELKSISPEVIVVAAYAQFLSRKILIVPPLGVVNIHPSLLPSYRGPSPILSSILAGDEKTGVSLMLLESGIDTGPILAQLEVPIYKEDTSQSLGDKLFYEGGKLLIETLPKWADNTITPRQQNHMIATTTRKFVKEDGLLNWNKAAVVLWREMRAFYPWPSTYTFLNGKRIKMIKSSIIEDLISVKPGTVIDLTHNGLRVATGKGSLVIYQLQVEGKKVIDAREFLMANPEVIGSTFG
jgi:methionyl-tRNA formyltransferase